MYENGVRDNFEIHSHSGFEKPEEESGGEKAAVILH